MKKFIPLAALFISLVFSSACFSEWTLISKGVNGDHHYIDFESIQIKNKRSVFYWKLSDFTKQKHGDLSGKGFKEADCEIPRKSRLLAFSAYTQPMAQGNPSWTKNKPGEWLYPHPGSVMEYVLEKVCAWAKKK